jgi:hypothetical protein
MAAGIADLRVAEAGIPSLHVDASLLTHLEDKVLPELKKRVHSYGSRMVFDPGVARAGKAQTSNTCAYYTSTTPPSVRSQCDSLARPAAKLTLDLAHYERVVWMLDSFVAYPSSSMRTWATRTRVGLARQFVEKVSSWQPATSPTTPAVITLANYFGDDRGDAPRGWDRVFFKVGASGAPNASDRAYPDCTNDELLNHRDRFWKTCSPYLARAPGYAKGGPYVLWSKVDKEIAAIGTELLAPGSINAANTKAFALRAVVVSSL